MVSERDDLTLEEKIEQGKNFIEQIKRNNLGEKRNDTKAFMMKQDTDVQYSISNLLDKLKEKEIDICTGDITYIRDIIEEEQGDFRTNKLKKVLKMSQEQIEEKMKSIAQKVETGNDLDDEEQKIIDEINIIGAETGKIGIFGAKMIEIREKTIDEITRRMKDYLIRDLVDNSRNSEMPQFSPKGWKVYFGIKAANYGELVRYSNFDFQTEVFPQAMRNMIEECADSLVQSGAIRNKFYDKNINELVLDENARRCMKTKYRPEETYTSYRKKHGISDIKGRTSYSDSQFTGTKEQQQQIEMASLYGNLYRYVQDRNETFASIYEDTYFAIETKVKKKVEDWVLEPELEKPVQPDDSEKLKKNKNDFSEHFYYDELKEQINEMRKEIINIYGTMRLTQQQKDEYIKEKIKQERDDMERKIALQLSLKYFAQMTDRSFEETAIKTGHLPEDLRKNAKRGKIESKQANGYINEIKEQQIPQAAVVEIDGEYR